MLSVALKQHKTKGLIRNEGYNGNMFCVINLFVATIYLKHDAGISTNFIKSPLLCIYCIDIKQVVSVIIIFNINVAF